MVHACGKDGGTKKEEKYYLTFILVGKIVVYLLSVSSLSSSLPLLRRGNKGVVGHGRGIAMRYDMFQPEKCLKTNQTWFKHWRNNLFSAPSEHIQGVPDFTIQTLSTILDLCNRNRKSMLCFAYGWIFKRYLL